MNSDSANVPRYSRPPYGERVIELWWRIVLTLGLPAAFYVIYRVTRGGFTAEGRLFLVFSAALSFFVGTH